MINNTQQKSNKDSSFADEQEKQSFQTKSALSQRLFGQRSVIINGDN